MVLLSADSLILCVCQRSRVAVCMSKCVVMMLRGRSGALVCSPPCDARSFCLVVLCRQTTVLVSVTSRPTSLSIRATAGSARRQ
jgi:hypothetical protein